MSAAAFEGYIERTGFAARITAAQAEPIPEEDPVTTPAPPAAVSLCASCLKADVCTILAGLTDEPDVKPLRPGVLIRATWVIVECAHHLPHARGGLMPETVRPPQIPTLAEVLAEDPDEDLTRVAKAAADMLAESRRRGAATARQRVSDERIIELLREHGGNRSAAAFAVGLSATVLRRRVEAICARGDMPPEVAATLSSKPGARPRAVAS
jgi:hypothetical protein